MCGVSFLNEESREQTLFLLPKNHLYNQMAEIYFRVGNTPFTHPITLLMVCPKNKFTYVA